MSARNSTKPRAWCLGIGEEFDLLRVVGPLVIRKNAAGTDRPAYLCHCECGKEKVIDGHSLVHRSTRSCGCLRNDKLRKQSTTHGHSGARLYYIWFGMKARCENPEHAQFSDYGERGIRVCDEWQDIEAFIAWARSSGYRDDLTIERKNVNLGYDPDNCEWLPKADQPKNRRNTLPSIAAFGETKQLGEWSRDARCRVSLSTLTFRIQRGWHPERAITEPPRPINHPPRPSGQAPRKRRTKRSKPSTS